MQREKSPDDRRRGSGNDRTVVLFLLALGVLLPPGLWVWVAHDQPWWGLYLAWLFVIAATAVINGRRPR